MPNPNKVGLFDDFLGDTLDSRWNFAEGTDAATSAAALTTGAGGILLLTTGDAGTGYAADAEQMNLGARSEEHTSELQSLMRTSYAVFCLKKKTNNHDEPVNEQSEQRT